MNWVKRVPFWGGFEHGLSSWLFTNSTGCRSPARPSHPAASRLPPLPRAPTPWVPTPGRRPLCTDRPPTVAQLAKPKHTTFQHTCAHAVLLAQLP
eukprot:3219012-Prymnesium_polylepis.1